MGSYNFVLECKNFNYAHLYLLLSIGRRRCVGNFKIAGGAPTYQLEGAVLMQATIKEAE